MEATRVFGSPGAAGMALKDALVSWSGAQNLQNLAELHGLQSLWAGKPAIKHRHSKRFPKRFLFVGDPTWRPTDDTDEAMTMLGRSLEDRMHQSGKKLTPQSVVPWMEICFCKLRLSFKKTNMENPTNYLMGKTMVSHVSCRFPWNRRMRGDGRRRKFWLV